MEETPGSSPPPPPDALHSHGYVDDLIMSSPSSRGRAWLEPALAVIVAVLVMAGGIAVITIPDDSAGSLDSEASGPGRGGTTATTEEPPPADAVAAIQAVVPELQAFVEQARGLKFKTPVDVKALSDTDFRRRLDELEAEAEAEAEEEEGKDAGDAAATANEDLAGVLRALGLLEEGVDLDAEAEKLGGDAIAGFYDPETNELVVRGDHPSPFVRSTIVHELTHALQDQHFELHRPDLEKRDDEAEAGFTGLVEGDAVRIENLYSESLSPAEREAAAKEEQEQASGIDEDTPQVLIELIGFPYIVGPTFAEAIIDSGGQAALDRAFTEPPLSSEHLIHPETFFREDDPKEVDAPKPEGEEVDHGVLGELGLLLILERALGRDDALTAAEGWGGDRYTAWKDGDRYCVRARIIADSAGDAREMMDAFEAWADDKGRTEVAGRASARSPLTFTTCE